MFEIVDGSTPLAMVHLSWQREAVAGLSRRSPVGLSIDTKNTDLSSDVASRNEHRRPQGGWRLPIGIGVEATCWDGRQAYASTHEGKLSVAEENAGDWETVQTVTTGLGTKIRSRHFRHPSLFNLLRKDDGLHERIHRCRLVCQTPLEFSLQALSKNAKRPCVA